MKDFFLLSNAKNIGNFSNGMKSPPRYGGPKHAKTFRNKYLTVVVSVMALIISHFSYAQLQPINGFGFKWKGMQADSIFNPPVRGDSNLSSAYRAVLKSGSFYWDSVAKKQMRFYDGAWHVETTGGGGTYTADEISIHLSGTQFGIKNTWLGQTSITTLGTIGTGTWQGSQIADTYISSANTWNAKLTSSLTSANIFVGSNTNVATARAVSGDWTINNTGAVTNTGLRGNALPSLSSGKLSWNGSVWIFDNTTYLTSATLPNLYAKNGNHFRDDSTLVWGGTLDSITTIDGASTYPLTFQNINPGVWFKEAPRLKTSSTAGQAWIATDANGNGNWGNINTGYYSARDTFSKISGGFVIGDFIGFDSATATWVKATTTNIPRGVVSKVIDANTFIMTTEGPMDWASGFSVLRQVYAHASTAGAGTTIPPTLNCPVGFQQTTNVFVVHLYHPVDFTGSGSSVTIPNLGSGYRLWAPQTPGLKSLIVTNSNGLLLDSATSGSIGMQVDSSKYATLSYVLSHAGSGGGTFQQTLDLDNAKAPTNKNDTISVQVGKRFIWQGSPVSFDSLYMGQNYSTPIARYSFYKTIYLDTVTIAYGTAKLSGLTIDPLSTQAGNISFKNGGSFGTGFQFSFNGTASGGAGAQYGTLGMNSSFTNAGAVTTYQGGSLNFDSRGSTKPISIYTHASGSATDLFVVAFENDQRTSFGSTTNPAVALVQMTSTSQAQNAWIYNSSNYVKATVNSSGDITFGFTGGTAATFSNTNLFINHIGGTGTATVTADGGAGTSPTISCSPCHDLSGQITLTTGSSGMSGLQAFHLTFATNYGSTAIVNIFPVNGPASALAAGTQLYASPAADHFDAFSPATNLATSTTYVWGYIVTK